MPWISKLDVKKSFDSRESFKKEENINLVIVVMQIFGKKKYTE